MDAVLAVLLPRKNPYAHCTKDTCPVEDSVYGYYPSKVGTLIFTAIFVVSLFFHLFQGIKWRSWTFLIALTIGTFGEAVGYVGRYLLRNNPFSKTALAIQIICLTVAPAFIAGGIYLTLKHIIIIYGAKFSRIAPKWYTWIFIFCDITSILIQSAGAVISSQGSIASTGNSIMMVGLASQVATLVVFGIMAIDVFFRIRKFRGEFNESTNVLRKSRHFKGLLASIVLAYAVILIRCIYRIAEMAGGWRNPIMQDQVAFIILDSVMCAIAVLALNVFHPGFLFKQSYATLKLESSVLSDTQMELK